MPEVTDVQIRTRSARPENERDKLHRIIAIITDVAPLVSADTGATNPSGVLVQGSFAKSTTVDTGAFEIPSDTDILGSWDTFDGELEMLVSEGFLVTTRATNNTSTTVSALRALLQAEQDDERLKKMSPERRALYDRIRALRERIGPVEFDAVQAIREIRDGE